MKKFVSTLTSLCMSVSLTAGTLAAFSTSAADISNVPVQKTLKLLADGKANYTVSAEDIAKGDVVIEVGVYIEEDEATTGTVTAKMGISSAPDESAIKITKMGDIYKDTVDSYDYTFKGGANDGVTVTTTSRLAFYGSYKKATKKVSNIGSILASNVFESENRANFIYSAGATKPAWLGATSDEFPVNTFEVTLKQNAAPGEYKVDFVNESEDAGNGALRNMTQVGFWDVSIKNPLDNLLVGGLGLEGLTITVEGDTPATTTTTAPAATTTTTATTTKPAATTTVTTGGSVTPMPDGLVWKVDDVKLTREELVANDGLVLVPVRVAQVSDQMIAGAAFTFKLADELTWEGAEMDTTNYAYDNCTNVLNETEPKVNFACPQKNPNGGRDIGYVCTEEGAVIIELVVSLPTDVADGKYDIDMLFEGVDRAVADNDNTTAEVTLMGGSVTIGDVTEPTTASTTATTATSTTKATTTTTKAGSTTTTSKVDPTTGNVLYGDSNVDGKVNIADVVCLNQYLVDNAKYDLSAQGKINAEVNLDGKLTAADSTSIIKSLVKLVTLPDKA
ncbi:MAG: dockerin type I repeat-containing protein [Ruminococcus sp.]|nr:dockerin type I repeat-containing protein [Oscillospiraceae bacterium]MDY4414109.1 dockerin type I repeat-containing protein [Ruminococcus sp.]